MGFKQAKISDKQKLTLELNTLSPQYLKLSKRINYLKEQIKDIEVKERAKGLQMTKHAIERYRERMNKYVSDTEIRDIIITDNFLDLYFAKGEGRLYHPDIKDCIVVVQDKIIVTIINTFDYKAELKKLGEYMNYYINRMETDEIVLNFEKFKIQNKIRASARKSDKNE